MTPKFPTKKSTGENPYFCMVKLSENRISNNIPFAKLEMIKKLIFVKSRFSVDFFVVSNTVIPREKSLDLICFFFLKTLFFQENRKTFQSQIARGTNFRTLVENTNLHLKNAANTFVLQVSQLFGHISFAKQLGPNALSYRLFRRFLLFWSHPLRRRGHTWTYFSGS